MSDILGRLERVEIKDVWPTEDRHFTPWLALPENIEVLCQTLNMELEVEEVEQFVGSYRADIVCRDTEDGSLVIIENQYSKTDHKHIGQLLTYLAGTEAKTAVWIAETFGDEHREMIDWLNENTIDDYRFFALEIELWRIGQSAPAPKFNVVSKPNDWTQSVRRAARSIADGALTDTRALYLRYWTAFKEYLSDRNSPLKGGRTPRPQHWLNFAIGRSGFGLSALLSAQKDRIGVELYISRDNSRAFFDLLSTDRIAIEGEFGEPLEWMPLPNKKACRIVVFKDADPTIEEQWPQQHAWLAEKLERLHAVFQDRIKSLDINDLERDDE